jgi:large subunit ribosomal protein L19
MALHTTHTHTLASGETQDNKFGVGDVVRVHQKIQESEDKFRTQVFEGIVLGIKGHAGRKTFTVRRIGAQKIGIEQIFPVLSPNIEKIEVVREGLPGVQHSKLYYIRDKSTREIEKIYSRAKKKNAVEVKAKKAPAKKKAVKKTSVKKVTPKKAAK